jgi:hypothetical protein
MQRARDRDQRFFAGTDSKSFGPRVYIRTPFNSRIARGAAALPRAAPTAESEQAYPDARPSSGFFIEK